MAWSSVINNLVTLFIIRNEVLFTTANRNLFNSISIIKVGWLFLNQWFGLRLRWPFSNYVSTLVWVELVQLIEEGNCVVIYTLQHAAPAAPAVDISVDINHAYLMTSIKTHWYHVNNHRKLLLFIEASMVHYNCPMHSWLYFWSDYDYASLGGSNCGNNITFLHQSCSESAVDKVYINDLINFNRIWKKGKI